MHPVISSVIRYKKMADYETAKPLVAALNETIFMDSTDIFTFKIPFIAHAVSVTAFYEAEDDLFASLLNNIAVVYSRQGDYPKALEWYHKALAILEHVLGHDHPNTKIVYKNMMNISH